MQSDWLLKQQRLEWTKKLKNIQHSGGKISPHKIVREWKTSFTRNYFTHGKANLFNEGTV